MVIGIPKEIMHGERRVSATPETVKKFMDIGIDVLVENGAGAGSHFDDAQYVASGAKMGDARYVYTNADLILKVKEPLYNSELKLNEVDLMKNGQYLITFIHPASPVNHEMVKNLAKKGIISLTLDGVPRISRAQNMDALTSMSTCAGYKGIIMAADSISKFIPQIFCAVGMIKPINVLVIGVGVAGLQAIATAKRLGAVVHGADIRPMAIEQVRSLGATAIEMPVSPEDAMAEGGYAKMLSDELILKEREVLAGILPKMDIVFCSALVQGERAPILITEEMVKAMPNGSCIVDISIDQGGNCAITTPGEVDTKHGVILNGIKNIPGLLPTSSTWMFAQNVFNLVKFMYKDGKIVLDRDDEIIAKTLVTIDGKIVHKGALKAMNA